MKSELVIVNEASLSVLQVSSPEGTSLWGIQFVKVRCVLHEENMYWNSVASSYDQFHNTYDITVCVRNIRRSSLAVSHYCSSFCLCARHHHDTLSCLILIVVKSRQFF